MENAQPNGRPEPSNAGLAVTTVEADLPRLAAETFDEHVDIWGVVDESIRGHFWMLGAIAASVQAKFGRRGVIDFAKRVHTSTRRIEEYASTYRDWSAPGRERSQLLTFTHHTIASRADDPVKAIQTAEHPPGENGKGTSRPYSTRELALWVAGEDPRPPKPPKTSPAEPDEPTIEQQRECYAVCPECSGRGVVWIG